jgi:hypothetical protein
LLVEVMTDAFVWKVQVQLMRISQATQCHYQLSGSTAQLTGSAMSWQWQQWQWQHWQCQILDVRVAMYHVPGCQWDWLCVLAASCQVSTQTHSIIMMA